MPKEIKILRKILSLFIFIFALMYYFTDQKTILIIFSILLLIFIIFDLLHFYSKGQNKISKIFFKLYPKKEKEIKTPITDATIFFISAILLTLLFQKEIVVMSLIILTFVDASEQIFGISIKSKKLPWNKDKSYAGTIAGLITGIIVCYLSIIYLFNSFPYSIIIPLAIVSSLAGTAKKYDNILIPWSVAILLTLINL